MSLTLMITSSGYNNVGQEAVVSQMLRELKAEGTAPTVTSSNRKLSEKLHGISFIEPNSFRFILDFLRASTVIIAGDELSNKKLDSYYRFNHIQGKLKVYAAFLAALLKKKVIFDRVGLYSMQRHFPKRLLAYALKHASKVTARDKETEAHLKKLGARDISVKKDPGYDLPYKKKDCSGKCIGISLVDPQDKRKEREIFRVVREMKEQNKKAKLVFFIFSAHPKIKAENDNYITQRVFRALGGKHETFFSVDPIEMKSTVAGMDYFICMRYHSAVFSISAGVPNIILSTGGKTKTLGGVRNFSSLKGFKI